MAVFEMLLTKNDDLTGHIKTPCGELRYSSVNFTPSPLLFHTKGGVVPLKIDRTSLENTPVPLYRDYSQAILPGSTFLFSTDGLIKIPNTTRRYEDYCQNIGLEYNQSPPEIIVQAIERDFTSLLEGIPFR